jgi:hypothetical protein
MHLSETERQQALAFLRNAMRGSCSSCRGNDWELNDTVLQMPEYGAGYFGQSDFTSTRFPVVVVVCRRCFNTRFFSAKKLGLVR